MTDVATELRRRSIPLESEQLPRAVDAEAGLISAALDDTAARELALSLPAGAITIAAYQPLVALMKAAHADGEAPDRIALLERAAGLGMDRMALFETMADIEDAASWGVADRHAKIVRERYEQRLVIHRVHATLQQMVTTPDEARRLAGMLVSGLLDFAATSDTGFVPMGTAIGEAFDDAERRARGDRTAFIRTGIAQLDDDPVGGLEAGDLATWMMVSGHGKTAALVLLAARACIEGTGVGIISAEMVRRQIGRRMIALLAGLPFFKLKTWQLSSADIAKAVYAKHLVDQWPCFIDDMGTPKLSHVVTQTRRLVQRHPTVKLVLIDYVTLIEGTGGTAAEAHGQVIRALKKLAKELQIAIVALVQPDAKTVERRGDDAQMPELADMAWCQEFRNQSDIVIAGYRPGEVQHQRNGVRGQDFDGLFMQRKGRNTGGGRWRWSWDGATMGFDGGCWGWFDQQYDAHRRATERVA